MAEALPAAKTSGTNEPVRGSMSLYPLSRCAGPAAVRLVLTLGLLLGVGCASSEQAAQESAGSSQSRETSDAAAPRGGADTEAAPGLSPPEVRRATADSGSRPGGESRSMGLDSGIEGMVSVGPSCPVAEAGAPCPDRPYRAEIEVRDAASGEIVTTVSSAEDGTFRIDLPAGDYILDPGQPRLISDPRAEPVPVTVEPHRYTHVVVRFDSGVR